MGLLGAVLELLLLVLLGVELGLVVVVELESLTLLLLKFVSNGGIGTLRTFADEVGFVECVDESCMLKIDNKNIYHKNFFLEFFYSLFRGHLH